jgi:hypothetical protein
MTRSSYTGFYNTEESLASCAWLKALGQVKYPENYPGDPFVVYRAV